MKKGDKPFLGTISNSLIIISAVWLLINIVVVYLFLNGGRAHRIESAAFIFAAAILIKLVSERESLSLPGEIVPSEEPPFRIKIVLFILPALIWALLYVPYIRAPFLSDDYVFLFKYSNSPFVFDQAEFFRPAFNSVFYVLLKIFGADPVPFRLLNLLLHLGCSVLVFKIAARLTSSFVISAVSTLFFLLNPLQAESVFWISGLQETLWVFFVLAAIWFYTRKRELTVVSISLASLCLALSLLSKETAVCFMALLIAVDFLAFGFKRGKNLKYAYLLDALMLTVYFFVRSHFIAIPGKHLPPASIYFLKQFLSQPFKSFLYPWNQVYAGALPGLKLAVALICAAVVSYRLLKKKPYGTALALCAMVFLFVPVMPLTRMFFVAPDLQGSRYVYLSAFGWGLLVSAAVFRLIKRKTTTVIFALFLTAVLSFCLKKNLEPWGKAGEIINSLPADIDQSAAPDNCCGAYILRNGTREYKILRTQTGSPPRD